MIDIHTHILPAFDDGASSVEESLALLEILSKQGVDTVALTSHYYGRRRSVKSFLSEYDRAFSRLAEAYGGDIKLIRASECNIHTCANSDFSELKSISIEGSRYILTELSFEKKWDDSFWERIDNLFLAGLIPVVAHVELYPAVQRRPDIAYQLVEMGCLLQVNCDSILDKKKSKLTNLLFGHNLIACIGSDTHNLQKRPPHYREAIDMITAEYGENMAMRLQENMKKILANEDINQGDISKIQRYFGRWK